MAKVSLANIGKEFKTAPEYIHTSKYYLQFYFILFIFFVAYKNRSLFICKWMVQIKMSELVEHSSTVNFFFFFPPMSTVAAAIFSCPAIAKRCWSRLAGASSSLEMTSCTLVQEFGHKKLQRNVSLPLIRWKPESSLTE